MHYIEEVQVDGIDYKVTFEYTPATLGSFDEPPEAEYYEIISFDRMNTPEYSTIEDIKELVEYENSREFNDALIEEIEELAKWKKKYFY